MNNQTPHTKQDLAEIARQAMLDRGLEPEFSPAVEKQLAGIPRPAVEPGLRDLTALLWCSIDNDDSRDLDQLSVSEDLGKGAVRLSVAIADVDAVVKKGTPIDDHARANTTSVYTAARIFPMLPERLSTDLTSLNQDEDRLAMVIEMTFDRDAALTGFSVYRATVRNKAKLAYDSVAAWLDGHGPPPPGRSRFPAWTRSSARRTRSRRSSASAGTSRARSSSRPCSRRRSSTATTSSTSARRRTTARAS